MAQRGERTWKRIPDRRRNALAESDQVKGLQERIEKLRQEGRFESARVLERRYLRESIIRNKRMITAAEKQGRDPSKLIKINETMTARLKVIGE